MFIFEHVHTGDGAIAPFAASEIISVQLCDQTAALKYNITKKLSGIRLWSTLTDVFSFYMGYKLILNSWNDPHLLKLHIIYLKHLINHRGFIYKSLVKQVQRKCLFTVSVSTFSPFFCSYKFTSIFIITSVVFMCLYLKYLKMFQAQQSTFHWADATYIKTVYTAALNPSDQQ